MPVATHRIVFIRFRDGAEQPESVAQALPFRYTEKNPRLKSKNVRPINRGRYGISALATSDVSAKNLTVPAPIPSAAKTNGPTQQRTEKKAQITEPIVERTIFTFIDDFLADALFLKRL